MTSSGCLPCIDVDATTAKQSPFLDVMEGSSSQRWLPDTSEPSKSY